MTIQHEPEIKTSKRNWNLNDFKKQNIILVDFLVLLDLVGTFSMHVISKLFTNFLLRVTTDNLACVYSPLFVLVDVVKENCKG